MNCTHRALIVIPAFVLLAQPTHAPAQSAETKERSTSQWQFAAQAMDWEAVEGLLEEVRRYRDADAIGAYELLVRTNGARFDAMVTAEIVDAMRLAELRGLEVHDSTSKEAVARDAPRPPPS